MGNFKPKIRDLIKNIMKPVYYLPYNIQLFIKGRKQEMLLPGIEQVQELLGDEKINVICVYSELKRVEQLKKGVSESEVGRYLTHWVNIDQVMEGKRENTLYVLLELFEYPDMAKRLHEKGLKDGKDFILLVDGARYRENYKEASRQRKWVEVEDIRKMNKQDWIKRIILMKDLIGEHNRSVLDIGCWEGELKEYLQGTIRYYGCDYVKRQQDTIVCDLNHYEFPTVDFDVAYISGSLEYMENLEWYFDQICKANHEVILSYSLLEYFPLIDIRKKKSWVNHLTVLEIMEYMKRRKFLLATSAFWGKWTVIFKFERKDVV